MTEDDISYMLLGVFYKHVWFSLYLGNYLLAITYLDWLVILGHVGILWYLSFAIRL